jgi:hypothetical protein
LWYAILRTAVEAPYNHLIMGHVDPSTFSFIINHKTTKSQQASFKGSFRFSFAVTAPDKGIRGQALEVKLAVLDNRGYPTNKGMKTRDLLS